ncbi:hypothetical protein H8J65_13965 [Clostridium perfringens]|uniref:hypothetical protein n=1 Tax=Clostridium perfringens TaxID=1502 RepID=UPI0018E4B3C4|nr:hypothetical protein [Clostridium perfringens]MBI5984284.1 hypothetical protein [Clostridium perfringens]
MTKKNQKNDEIIIENAENMSEEELKKAIKVEKARRTREMNKAKKEAELAAEETKNNGDSFNLDAILAAPKYKKKSLSFNQDKSVSEALNTRAEAAGKKASEALNLILESIIDVESGICKVDIEEKKEEKIPNTYKVDERVLNVLKKEADLRNMSINEYLNKVLKIVLNIG